MGQRSADGLRDALAYSAIIGQETLTGDPFCAIRPRTAAFRFFCDSLLLVFSDIPVTLSSSRHSRQIAYGRQCLLAFGTIPN